MLDFAFYAGYYYEFGLNITHISTKDNNTIANKDLYKAPSHKWIQYIGDRQSLADLVRFDW